MKKKSESKLKNIVIVVLVVLVLVLVFSKFKKSKDVVVEKEPFKETTEEVQSATPISITSKAIKEENFTGTMPVIVGSGALTEETRSYIEAIIADFKMQADRDVPAMRKQYGSDAPMASYTLDVEAKYKKGVKTDSVIVSGYAYTGGANGHSFYKVKTVSNATGKILFLADIIKADKQGAFTEFVKKQLNTWKSEGGGTSPVFPEVVKELKFSSFDDWSINDTSLVIYFDKYEIGPGVMGAVAFPVPIAKIKDFLSPPFN